MANAMDRIKKRAHALSKRADEARLAAYNKRGARLDYEQAKKAAAKAKAAYRNVVLGGVATYGSEDAADAAYRRAFGKYVPSGALRAEGQEWWKKKVTIKGNPGATAYVEWQRAEAKLQAMTPAYNELLQLEQARDVAFKQRDDFYAQHNMRVNEARLEGNLPEGVENIYQHGGGTKHWKDLDDYEKKQTITRLRAQYKSEMQAYIKRRLNLYKGKNIPQRLRDRLNELAGPAMDLNDPGLLFHRFQAYARKGLSATPERMLQDFLREVQDGFYQLENDVVKTYNSTRDENTEPEVFSGGSVNMPVTDPVAQQQQQPPQGPGFGTGPGPRPSYGTGRTNTEPSQEDINAAVAEVTGELENYFSSQLDLPNVGSAVLGNPLASAEEVTQGVENVNKAINYGKGVERQSYQQQLTAIEEDYQKRLADIYGATHNPAVTSGFGPNMPMMSGDTTNRWYGPAPQQSDYNTIWEYHSAMWRFKNAKATGNWFPDKQQLVAHQQGRKQLAAAHQPMRSPNQQAAISAVIAQNTGAVGQTLQSSVQGMSVMLRQQQRDEDGWLAQNAIALAHDRVKRLEQKINLLDTNAKRNYLLQNPIADQFKDIFEFYQIKSPDIRKNAEDTVNRLVTQMRVRNNIRAPQQLIKEQQQYLRKQDEKLINAVFQNPTEEGIAAARQAHFDATDGVYTTAEEFAVADEARRQLIFKGRIQGLLSTNPKAQNLQQAEQLLEDPMSGEVLSNKELQQAFNVLAKHKQAHQDTLRKRKIGSIQQWADGYGRSKKLMTAAVGAAGKGHFGALLQTVNNPELLPEDKQILQTMISKAKAKLEPQEGSVKPFAANEPIGYRGKQYKLGRDNKLVSDADGTRDMLIENSFRTAFNRALQNDPMGLHAQLFGPDVTTEMPVEKRRERFSGMALTEDEAKGMGQALLQLSTHTPQQRGAFLSKLQERFGDSTESVINEALGRMAAKAKTPEQMLELRTAKMGYNAYLSKALPPGVVTNAIRTVRERGILKPKMAGVNNVYTHPSLYAIRDSVPAWAFDTLDQSVQQLAIHEAMMADKLPAGVDDPKEGRQHIYEAALERLSGQIRQGFSIDREAGKSAQGVDNALNGLLLQGGSLDVPAHIVDYAGPEAGLRAMDFARSFNVSAFMQHKDALDNTSQLALERAGEQGKLRLASRNDRPGAFVVVLEQGDAVMPIRLQSGDLFTILAEDILLQGNAFSRFSGSTPSGAEGPMQMGAY